MEMIETVEDIEITVRFSLEKRMTEADRAAIRPYIEMLLNHVDDRFDGNANFLQADITVRTAVK